MSAAAAAGSAREASAPRATRTPSGQRVASRRGVAVRRVIGRAVTVGDCRSRQAGYDGARPVGGDWLQPVAWVSCTRPRVTRETG